MKKSSTNNYGASYRFCQNINYLSLGRLYKAKDSSCVKYINHGLYGLLSDVSPEIYGYQSGSVVLQLNKNIFKSCKISIKNTKLIMCEKWRLGMLDLISSYSDDDLSNDMADIDLLKIKLYSFIQHNLHMTMFEFENDLRDSFNNW